MKAIINGKIIHGNEVYSNQVLLYDHKIFDYISLNEFRSEEYEDIIDAQGQWILPGFIDIHIHGAGGCDTMDGTEDAFLTISQTIVKNGVTGFLPTTMTAPKEDIQSSLSTVRKFMKQNLNGAQILGAHLEGPFINVEFMGAQNPDYIAKPKVEFIKEYLDIIKIITFAPEMDEDHSFIHAMKQYPQITLSIGHSGAEFETALEAVKNGVRHVTHLFNAMSPLHHRKPGVVGAAFSSDVTCEIIVDNIHIHPGLYPFIIQNKGVEQLVLITDSMRAGCMKEGVYELGGQKVIVKEGSARLESGTIAGSILTLEKAFQNMIEFTDLSIQEVSQLLSLNPAKVIHMDKKKGSLEIGKDADIVFLNEDFEVMRTVVGGNTIWAK